MHNSTFVIKHIDLKTMGKNVQAPEKIIQSLLVVELTLQWINPRHHRVYLFTRVQRSSIHGISSIHVIVSELQTIVYILW